jgi:hypothetical protein
MVSSGANKEDSDKLDAFVATFTSNIQNANVTFDNEMKERLYGLMDFIMSKIDSALSGVDPTELLSLSDAPNKSTEAYNIQNSEIDPQKDAKFDPKDPLNVNVEPNATPTGGRMLQSAPTTASAKKSAKKYNENYATLVIPQSATQKLSPASVSFVQQKDPSPMQQPNSPTIQTFVVNVKATPNASDKKVKKVYPDGADPMIISIPWTKTTVNDDYVKNCKVYSFNGKDWVDASKVCKITTNCNSTTCSVACAEFNTYGISCAPGTGKIAVVKKNGFNISMSFSLIAILGILLL